MGEVIDDMRMRDNKWLYLIICLVFIALLMAMARSSASAEGLSATPTETETIRSRTIEGVTLNKNVHEAWDILRDRGYSEVACAAILGNFHRESGLNPWRMEGYTKEESLKLDPLVTKDRNTFLNKYHIGGYGLAQWTGNGNREDLWDYCEENGYAVNSLEGQLRHFDDEFREKLPDSMARMEYYSPEDIVLATEDFRQCYERSVKVYGSQYARAKWAKAIYLECSENPDTFEAVEDAPYNFEIYVAVNKINSKLGLTLWKLNY